MASAMIHEWCNELVMLQLRKASKCTFQSVMREALVGDKLVSSLRFNPSTSAGQVVQLPTTIVNMAPLIVAVVVTCTCMLQL